MRRLFLVCLSLAFLQAAHAQSSSPNPPVTSDRKPLDTGAAASPSPGVGDDYKIGPQDVVRIDVWKEPDITRTIPVRPDGKISLPLLNDVQASGLTAMQLAGNIRTSLTKYITNPQVTV